MLALDDFAQRANQREHAEFLAEAARMRAQALDLTGTVVLTGLLAGTTVQVDHEARRWPAGPTHQLSLDPGHHELTLRAPDHQPSTVPVDVARGVSTQRSPTWIKLLEDEASEPPPASPWQSAWLWGGVAAVGVGALAVVLALTLGPETSPPSGGSLDMVFE